MNYLQLVQRAKLEAGLAGAVPSSIGSTVGDTARIAGWVSDAYNDLQLQAHRNWRWLRSTATGTVTVAGGMSYTIDQLLGVGAGTTRFSRWRNEGNGYRVRAWPIASPEQVIDVRQLDHDEFVRRFLVGTHAAAAPQYWAIAPSGEILVGPTPDASYRLRADYVKSPQQLTLDGDTPEMAPQFHMAIVWLALWSYAGYDAAPEVGVRAQTQYEGIELGLVAQEAEGIRFGGRPLA